MNALTVTGAAEAVLAAIGRGDAVVTVSVISDARPNSATGARIVITSAGETLGSLGPADEAALQLAQRALEKRTPQLESAVIAGSSLRLFAEPVFPTQKLVIVGAGHIAVPLASMGRLIDFDVLVLDDREEFATGERFAEGVRVERMDFERPFETLRIDRNTYVVLVTRAHKHDYDALRHLLDQAEPPGYVGMIGSRRRVRATFDALESAGYDPERFRSIHAPVGLDIGAETPAEIAVSIAAEIIRVRSGEGTSQKLVERERIIDRFYPGNG